MTPVNTSVAIGWSPIIVFEDEVVQTCMITNDGPDKVYRSRWNSGDTPQPAVLASGSMLQSWDRLVFTRSTLSLSFISTGASTLLLQYS